MWADRTSQKLDKRLYKTAVWRLAEGVRERHCNSCKTWKSHTVEHFYSNGDKGLGTTCRPCHRAMSLKCWHNRQRPKQQPKSAVAVGVPLLAQLWK